MTHRYLLIVKDEVDHWNDAPRRLSFLTGLDLSFCSSRLAALVDIGCQCVSIEGSGCVLGSLFRRDGSPNQLNSFSALEAAEIARSDGSKLFADYWGGYIAAIARLDSIRILRDPSGNFPCYYSSCGRFRVFASDAELLRTCGAAINIDHGEIGRQLYRAYVPAPTTALHGVRELLAGFSLRISSQIGDQECSWSPWGHARICSLDRAEKAEQLATIINHCVHAWASTHKRLLLSASGGLDSSIVGACLATVDAETVCLTMFTDDPAGDERSFARSLCKRLRMPLIERAYRIEDIDIDEPLAGHLPRPRDRTQALAFERVHRQVAEEIGADGFITGNGGDNVFGYSQSAGPLADRYLAQGAGPGLIGTLLDLCGQTGCSMMDAVVRAWRLANDQYVYRVQEDPIFLHPDFTAGLSPADLRHPWLDAPPAALPGKAAHIATILRVQPNLEASRAYHLPVLNPLMSQPIVEFCLGIPSWEWRTGGRDRSLVRDAFASQLPCTVMNRRVKGTPSRFAARLLDHFRVPIRNRLVGGRLASLGIIDAKAIESVLAGERPVPDLARVRILELANAEAWIDHWSSQAQKVGPF